MNEYILGFILLSCVLVAAGVLYFENKNHKAKMAAFEKEWENLVNKGAGVDHE